MIKKEHIKTVGLMLLAIPFLGFGVGSIKVAPDYVSVIPLKETNEFFAPGVCDEILQKTIAAQGVDTKIILPIKKSDAYEAGFKPNGDCVNTGAFVQDGRSITGDFLEKMNLLKPLPSRWNEDGTWNW